METLIHKYGQKTYNYNEVCAFRKTKEEFGGLSNMASGFPLYVNGVHILTSEALYQACRFPHLPDVQKIIIEERSPMSAKMKGKPYRVDSRQDFEDKKVDIMRWCLRVKLAQNFFTFAKLLESTKDKDIIEDSHKDRFWGAVKDSETTLTGANVLGRLLKQIRQEYYDNKFTNISKFLYVEPPKIKDFLLFGQEIGVIDERENFLNYLKIQMNIRVVVENKPVLNEVNELYITNSPKDKKQNSKAEKKVTKKNKKSIIVPENKSPELFLNF